jgi:hypothetical protein
MVRKTDNPTDPIGPPELPLDEATVANAGQSQDNGIANSTGSDDVAIPNSGLDTPESDAAIDAIVADEADQILAAQDAGVETAQEDAMPNDDQEKHGHPVFWFVVVLLVVLAVIAAYVLMNPDINVPFSA